MEANNTYNVVIANEACNFTATKFNTTLTGFAHEAAHNAAKEALRDIAGELGYFNYKVIYSSTLDAWVLINKRTQDYIMVAKIEEATETNTTPETSETMKATYYKVTANPLAYLKANDITGDPKFRYGLLGRMLQDIKYYLGFGNRCACQLWAGDETTQIKIMFALWMAAPTAPKWLTLDQLWEYAKQMNVDLNAIR